MASYNDIFSFLNQNAKFYYDEIEEKQRKAIEARILRDFRKTFQGEFEEYKNNVFYLYNINIVIKFLFGETDVSIAPLKFIAGISDCLFLAVRLFQGEYNIRVANLPLIKKAYQINHESEKITGSVKWEHLEKFYTYGNETLRNDASNILLIHDAIYQNYDIKTEIDRIYNYELRDNSFIETEKFILFSPEVRELCRYIKNTMSVFPTSFLNMVFSSGEALRNEYFAYMITLLSQYNEDYILQESKKATLFKRIPSFQYKNKYRFIYQGLNVDIHFILNGFGDYQSFLSESRYNNKVVLICHIDMNEHRYNNIAVSMQGLRSKEWYIFND